MNFIHYSFRRCYRFSLVALLVHSLFLSCASAQSNGAIEDPFFDDMNRVPIRPIRPSEVSEPVSSTTDSKAADIDLLSVDPAFLLSRPQLLQQLLEQSVQQFNWDLIRHLIPLYERLDSHDSLLLWYAKGALYRHDREHPLAIQMYKNMLARDPSLLYIRFDLAIMLFEDKQYDSALDQFRKVVAGELEPSYQKLANQYILAIQKKNTWAMDVSIQLENNNNVNNASYIDNAMGWEKGEDALPQKARGVRYSLQASRDFNLNANHYWHVSLSQYGVHYPKKSEYSERSTRLFTGYQYQDIDNLIRIGPLVERHFLGGRRYLNNIGVMGNYTHWFQSRYQSSFSYQYLKKSYQKEESQYYDGHTHYVGWTGAYFHSPTFILIGGLDYQTEKTQLQEDSYQRYGIRAGLIKEFNYGLSARVDLRYLHRRHREQSWYNSWFGVTDARRDNEVRTSLTLWHRAVSFYDVTPKITYSYAKNRSNIPFFFNKRTKDIYVTLEKTF